jgi:hypothetical protein
MRIFYKKCRNGLKQIQIVKPSEKGISLSFWMEGEKFAFLETSYLINSELANSYADECFNQGWVETCETM